MAILRLGAIITQISGKVGGQTLINGAQGTYLKNIGNQSKAPTPAQQKIRTSTAMLMQTWRTLSLEQQKSYTALVGEYSYTNRVGQIHFYNGFQIYMLLNQGRALINQPINNIGLTPTLVVSAATIMKPLKFDQLVLSIGNKTPNQSYVLWMTNPLGGGQFNVTNLLKKVKVIHYDDGQIQYDITQDYIDTFGNLEPNMRIGYTVQAVITVSGQTEKKPITNFFVIDP